MIQFLHEIEDSRSKKMNDVFGNFVCKINIFAIHSTTSPSTRYPCVRPFLNSATHITRANISIATIIDFFGKSTLK